MTTMNRQQAVEVLEQMRDMGTPPCIFAHDEEELAALDLAIAALRDEAGEAGNEFFVVPEGLHPHTVNLVARFATALAEKLAAAERKYGYSDNWAKPDWMDDCRKKLVEHVTKGDPRDVAAYCAFLWHHGEATRPAPQPAKVAEGFVVVPDAFASVMAEVERATRKFPTWPTDPLHAVAVLGEEFGELTKAVLQSVYEPHKVKPGEVRTEAVQTAAMALRFLLSLDRYDYAPGVQHEQQALTAAQQEKAK